MIAETLLVQHASSAPSHNGHSHAASSHAHEGHDEHEDEDDDEEDHGHSTGASHNMKGVFLVS